MKETTKNRIKISCIRAEKNRQLNNCLKIILSHECDIVLTDLGYKIYSKSEIIMPGYKYIQVVSEKTDNGFIYTLSVSETALNTRLKPIKARLMFLESKERAINSGIVNTDNSFNPVYKNQIKKNRHLPPKMSDKKNEANYLSKRQCGLVPKRSGEIKQIKRGGFLNEKHIFQSNVNTKVLTRSGKFKPIK